MGNITVNPPEWLALPHLSEAPGFESPGTAYTPPGPISPPLDLGDTA